MEEKKSNLGLWVVIGVLFVAVVGLSFYLGTKFANKEDKKETETKEETKVEFESVKLSDGLVADAKKYIATTLCGNVIYSFDREDNTFEELPEDYKFAVLVNFYHKEFMQTVETEKGYTLDLDDVKKHFDDISFIENHKGAYNFAAWPYSMEYKNGKYVVSGYPTGCIGIAEGYYYQAIDAKKSKDEFVLTVIAYYVKSPDLDDGELHAYVYRSEDDKEPIDKDPSFNEDTMSYNLTNDKYDKYEFVYNLDGSNIKLKEIKYVK
jgi:hypothetical protein